MKVPQSFLDIVSENQRQELGRIEKLLSNPNCPADWREKLNIQKQKLLEINKT